MKTDNHANCPLAQQEPLIPARRPTAGRRDGAARTLASSAAICVTVSG